MSLKSEIWIVGANRQADLSFSLPGPPPINSLCTKNYCPLCRLLLLNNQNIHVEGLYTVQSIKKMPSNFCKAQLSINKLSYLFNFCLDLQATMLLEYFCLFVFVLRLFHVWCFAAGVKFWRDKKNVIVLSIIVVR